MGIQKSFSEYYGETEFTDKTKNETISEKGNYYIHNAIFSFHYQKAAIYLITDNKVLIETCTFYNNSSKYYGGSFFIENSECVLIHLCILLSNNTNFGCGYCIKSYSKPNYKSYAFECSVSQCSGEGAPLYHTGGDIQVSNMNTSNHRITKYAAYSIVSSKGVGIINFTTASNASSIKNGAICNGDGLNITRTNYLNNEYNGSYNAIIYVDTVFYSNCSFIGNKGNYLFDKKPKAVENCYFNDNNVTQIVRSYQITYESIQPLDSLIIHYTTDKCSVTYFYPQKQTNIGGVMSLKSLKILNRRR
ncbi:hypothetical protein TVAG_051750 [Trichomonas vaginalis G3]|uniref:Right handed beta helix domain-containing protein n=1 Tax=Trichomonas vaginalis (strain ATCC PRA-98 / G3) TaxID=412133 RepID=A2FVU3_TRIV3|nr:pectin lyase-like family [Trichomonas vaginalis G3]EAX90974.1 hypothetical protein TVAG_051750 [Trichomonas vaginalis G3]KAI5512921.1 pectin lyase-like family [Trichomonas vaginalis G3]|eukprot:XP_001303904.1 hypothetical protein [Trichomonas vaginalis G3]